MAIKYIVASPGRSGSIFITNVISKSLGYQALYHTYHSCDWQKYTQSIVYHTHDATFQIPDINLTVIQPYRRDIFKEIISAVIAEHYNEWSNYSGNKQPFVADLETFRNKYQWHKMWHRAFEHYTRYQNRIYICFEDVVGDSIKVCDQLNIPPVVYTSEQSPYSKKNILNIDQLTDEFIKLELNPYIQNEPIEIQNWTDKKIL